MAYNSEVSILIWLGLNNRLLNIIYTTQTYKNDIKDQITIIADVKSSPDLA